MLHFNVNLTTLAVILWSGMLIISGSIWILASQVRKVADLMDRHTTVIATKSARRESSRGLIRTAATGPRPNAQTLLDAAYPAEN